MEDIIKSISNFINEFIISLRKTFLGDLYYFFDPNSKKKVSLFNVILADIFLSLILAIIISKVLKVNFWVVLIIMFCISGLLTLKYISYVVVASTINKTLTYK